MSSINPRTYDSIPSATVAFIGLGVMGWADMLLQLGVPYNSEEGTRLGERVMAYIETKSNETSLELAQERGVCDAILLGDALAVIAQANGKVRVPPLCRPYFERWCALPRPARLTPRPACPPHPSYHPSRRRRC